MGDEPGVESARLAFRESAILEREFSAKDPQRPARRLTDPSGTCWAEGSKQWGAGVSAARKRGGLKRDPGRRRGWDVTHASVGDGQKGNKPGEFFEDVEERPKLAAYKATFKGKEQGGGREGGEDDS